MNATCYTTDLAWASLNDRMHLDRVRTVQRLSTAFGPKERHQTTEDEWASLDAAGKRSLLQAEEMECANRAEYNRQVAAAVQVPALPPCR